MTVKELIAELEQCNQDEELGTHYVHIMWNVGLLLVKMDAARRRQNHESLGIN